MQARKRNEAGRILGPRVLFYVVIVSVLAFTVAVLIVGPGS